MECQLFRLAFFCVGDQTISQLLDLTDITQFTDDNYALVWNEFKTSLKVNMQTKLELITMWLKDSGLKVKEEKTEVLFVS